MTQDPRAPGLPRPSRNRALEPDTCSCKSAICMSFPPRTPFAWSPSRPPALSAASALVVLGATSTMLSDPQDSAQWAQCPQLPGLEARGQGPGFGVGGEGWVRSQVVAPGKAKLGLRTTCPSARKGQRGLAGEHHSTPPETEASPRPRSGGASLGLTDREHSSAAQASHTPGQGVSSGGEEATPHKPCLVPAKWWEGSHVTACTLWLKSIPKFTSTLNLRMLGKERIGPLQKHCVMVRSGRGRPLEQ